MTMSSRYGIRYSWYVGLSPAWGRYRFTRNTTSRSAMSVRPRHGLPLGDLHRRVIDARLAARAIRELVLRVIPVVPGREIGAAVGAPRLPPVQSAVGDRRRDVEHAVELEDPGHLRVKHTVLVRQADGGESVPQLGEISARVGEAGLVPEDPNVALHQLLHLHAHAGEGLLPSLATHEAVEDAGLLPPEGFSRRGSARIGAPLLRVLGRGEAAPLAEHEALAQAVRPEAVRAVDRDARGLADRVQAGKRRLPGRVRGHPAHDVMLARTHGDGLADRIEAHVLLREFADHRQLLVDRRGSEVTQVEAEIRPARTLDRAARFDLLDHRSGEDIPRPQLHLGLQVALHVALPVLVDQIAALAARRLRDQDARPREARRMELDHLHVLQRHAGAVGEGHAVARLDEAVRREFVHAAAPAGR